MFVSRGGRSPLFHFIIIGVGVALIVFALIDTTASRLVLVVGGVAIVVGLARGITSLSGARRDGSTSVSDR
jgi:Flp pilus assembly protein TadB